MDCGDGSCGGGLNTYGLNYVRDHKVNREIYYPYHAQDETCYSTDHTKYGINSYTDIADENMY